MVEVKKPEKKKRKSPQGAICMKCKGKITRGKGVCGECYWSTRDDLTACQRQLNEEEKERIRGDKINNELRAENAKMAALLREVEQPITSAFVFSVYQEPVPVGSEMQTGELMIEISESNKTRLRAPISVATKLADYIEAFS